MLTKRKKTQPDESSTWQAAFVAILPSIQRYAKFAFRGLPVQRRDDAVSSVVATCCVAFHRLAEQDRLHVAHPTVLVRFAIWRTRVGREEGGRLNVRDVLSPYAQRKKLFQVERLSRFDLEVGEWLDIVVEDKTAGPAEVAAMRIDFAHWLRLLPTRLRQIALFLATGETTSAAARRFGVSPGRISQLRRELMKTWEAFQSEQPVPTTVRL